MTHSLPTDKELIILNLLFGGGGKEMYGLQMIKESDDKLRRSSIYVLLTRMVARGYLSARLENEDEQDRPGPLRRLYEVTSFGQAMLAARLAADAAINPLIEDARNLKPAGSI